MGGWRAVRTRDGIGPRGKKFYCPRRTFRDDQQCVAINCKCSPKHANALGLFCLLRTSLTTLGANISSAWIMARGYFGIFRAWRASGCMCYSTSLLSTLLTKMPNSGKILHSCTHLDTHTYTFGLRCWNRQFWRISMFSMEWNGIWSCHFPCWNSFGFAEENDNNKWILLSLACRGFF